MAALRLINSKVCENIREEVERLIVTVQTQGGKHRDKVVQWIHMRYLTGDVDNLKLLLKWSHNPKTIRMYEAYTAIRRLLRHNGYRAERPKRAVWRFKVGHPIDEFPFSLDLDVNAEQWDYLTRGGWEWTKLDVETKVDEKAFLAHTTQLDRLRLLSTYLKLTIHSIRFLLVEPPRLWSNDLPVDLVVKELQAQGHSVTNAVDLLDQCDELHDLCDYIRMFEPGKPIVVVRNTKDLLPETFRFICIGAAEFTEWSGYTDTEIVVTRALREPSGRVTRMGDWLASI